MAPAVERREHTRGGKQLDRSISPVTNRHSPRQRSSPHSERLPGRQRSSSPSRRRSPQRNSTAYRRPFENDKLRDQAVQPKRERGRSPTSSSSSQSPSSHTKRTRKAQTERESEKVTSREDWRISREERKKGTAREFREKERTSSSPSPSPRTKRLMRVQTERESEKVTSRGDGKINRDERKKGSEREVIEKERSTSSRSLSPSTKRLMRVQTDREAEKVTNKEDERNSRDEHKKGRERENREQERTTNSRSPSPRTKRLMRAQAEHEVEKVKDRVRGRNTTKEVRDKGRTGEHGDAEDILNERRSTRDSKEGGSSRSSKRDRDHDRSFSPKERSKRMRHGSRSRSPSRMSRAHAREEVSNSRGAEQSRESDIDSIARMKAAEESLEAKEKDKQKPSFELSGKLAEETNRVRGITLLFNEPADARKPDVRWRLYVFKGGEVLNEPLYVHRQSCYLFGRERRVADIPTDHPSCSKQHAVIQYRLVEKEQPDGLMSKQVRPYVMDLGSTNGTFINDNRIEPQRYYELMEKDTIKFGNSSREYVILHENSVN